MKNLIMQKAIEILDDYICGNGGLYNNEDIKQAWERVRQFVKAKETIEDYRPVTNLEYIRSLPVEELAVFLSLDSALRTGEVVIENWIAQIEPTWDWLEQNTEFNEGDFSADYTHWNCYNIKPDNEYQGVNYQSLIDIQKEE